jgi:AhpD family alkylhydroperoxidase
VGASAATQELVKIRASQISGCAACTDMHTKDAQHAGESPVRLNLIAVWREAKVFTEAERAALELTEQGTRIADAPGGVTDEAWANAAKYYDDDQLAALVSLIALEGAPAPLGLRFTHHVAPSRAATDQSLGGEPRECLPRVRPVPPLPHQAWRLGASGVNLHETSPARRACRLSRLPHPPLHCGDAASPRRVYSRVRPSTRAFICAVGRRPSSFIRRR